MFQSTVALTVLLQYRISLVLPYKSKRDRLHEQRGRKSLQETQECAYSCDGGEVSQTHGHATPFHWQACQITIKQ